MKDKNTQGSTPEKAKSKKLYYIILAACALVLAAAIAFTVIMVTQDSPVSIEDPDKDQDGDNDNDDNGDNDGDEDGDKDDDDGQQTGGEVVFSMPVDGATVSATYSFWYNSTLNRYNLHEGIDFKADAGTNVAAAYDGTVAEITDTLLDGGCIVIDHGDGLQTVYSSVDVSSDLKTGDKVSQGDIMGTLSASADVMGKEYNEGSHLHFEIRKDGKAVDPASYLDLDEK